MEYSQTMNEMLQRLEGNPAYNTQMISKAFKFAETMHKGQKRKAGGEYIVHPVDVARTLEKMGFDTNLICAGLLHDTVEDCGYTVEQMSKDFNPLIAQIVDAVTEIKLDESEKNALDFPKEEEEIKTYHKLLSMGKTNKFAFYIKFSDRYNNLKTISCFQRYKQIEKVKQTERWLLPVIKLLNASKFYYLIKNQCFKIVNKELMDYFEPIYEKYINQNKNYFNNIRETLFSSFNDQLIKKNNYKIKKIIAENLTEWEIAELLPNNLSLKNFSYSKMNYFNKITTKKLFFIFNDIAEKTQLIKLFFELIENQKIKKIIKLVGYAKDNIFKNEYFILEDAIGNKFQCYLFTEKEYVEFMNGSSDGTEVDNLDDEERNNLSSKYIDVFTRGGECVHMPENSTVLDFAFKLHKELGFGCRYAHINDSPTKSPIYTHLSNGDKINLIIEKNDETGETKNIAKLRWLTYTHTEYAQKVLTKYFESLYE